MLAAVALILSPVFRVTHHVSFERSVFSVNDVRRDGTMVGSLGYMWSSSGEEYPVIVSTGRIKEISNLGSFPFSRVRTMLGRDRYRVEGDRGSQCVQLKLGKLVPIPDTDGNTHPAAAVLETSASPTEALVKLLPVPLDMDDTTRMTHVEWYRFGKGRSIGNAVFDCNHSDGYRAVFRDASGQIVNLDADVDGLSHFQLYKVWFVSRDGWAVVDGAKRDPNPRNGFTCGHGADLFWIEWR